MDLVILLPAAGGLRVTNFLDQKRTTFFSAKVVAVNLSSELVRKAVESWEKLQLY